MASHQTKALVASLGANEIENPYSSSQHPLPHRQQAHTDNKALQINAPNEYLVAGVSDIQRQSE